MSLIGNDRANARLWEISAREFSEVVDTNLKGVANVIRHFVPEMVKEVKIRGAVPLFVTVSVFDEFRPSWTLPKLRDVLDRLTVRAVPVPLRATACGLCAVLDVIRRLALSVPAAPFPCVPTLMLLLEGEMPRSETMSLTVI